MATMIMFTDALLDFFNGTFFKPLANIIDFRRQNWEIQTHEYVRFDNLAKNLCSYNNLCKSCINA